MSGLLDNKRWDVLPSDRKAERLLREELGVSPLVARVLVARGMRSVADARLFLSPSLSRDWSDPLDIPGMRDAADRVERALSGGESIVVFGDFDVDGMTSTCLLTEALCALGATVAPYIPHRFGEGYGLSRAALDRVMQDGQPDLVITVDNGIAAANEVAWLLDQGVDVVITDHHEPGDLVPRGVPVTDPKLSQDCPSRELAGAGVALKLVCELGRRFGVPDIWWDYVDLAALGTVSDMMLLQGENRSLVAHGIEQMRSSDRCGIVALAATAGVDLTQITADNLPFSLIPRLNAAGRMGTTEVALDLLMASDPAEAALLAGMLERTNTERRETEASLSSEALAKLETSYAGERVIVIAGDGWHEGVKGIVASRIVSKYHVPTIVFSVSDGIARGSGRSVGSVDLFHAVEQCADTLVRFGGHAGAVGVTCEVGNIDLFRTRLQEVMRDLPEDEFVDKGEVAAIVSLGELTREGIASLDCLQPFGQGNKRPLLGIRGVFMRNRARVGYDGLHLRFSATDGLSYVPSIMFRAPNVEKTYACDSVVDLVVDAVNETWQGRTNPKLMVHDILLRDSSEDARGDQDTATDQDVLSGCGDASEPGPGSAAERRASLSGLSVPELTERLRGELIGSSELLDAQRETLDILARGRNALCVMATGRGKSLIFHIHAARTALLKQQASVFVYPLRALVSDQVFHITDTFARWGLGVRVLTGETDELERQEIFGGLLDGTVDVVLTTPEFLAIHTRRFAACGRIGFIVVDEAHHAGVANGGNRSSYLELPRIRAELSNPVALAVTATASTPVAREICRLLSIADDDVVIDQSVRSNLVIDDHRDLRERDLLLVSIVATGEKTVVYVNSRDQAVGLVRTLRTGIPELGHAIAFYHAGLSRSQRLKVEQAFRDDRLCCIVCTSAFGEGVNLPGIRNVVLYHMPFGSTEFNQMSGRAGRDGKTAHVHLLFGSRDARINERILASAAPARKDLVTLYRALMTQARRGTGDVELSDEQLLDLAHAVDGSCSLVDASVNVGIAIFSELGFLEVHGFEEGRSLHMNEAPAHVELDQSTCYVEGLRALDEFFSFRDWALTSLSKEMLHRINRPISPNFGHIVGQQ